MDKQQEFTPKYWVGHDTREDDVLIYTARKNKYLVEEQMRGLFGVDWFRKDNPEIILVEINRVGVK